MFNMTYCVEYDCPTRHREIYTSVDLDIISNKIRTWEQCGHLCNITAECQYWTLTPDNGDEWNRGRDCILKYNTEGTVPWYGAESGDKNCYK